MAGPGAERSFRCWRVVYVTSLALAEHAVRIPVRIITMTVNSQTTPITRPADALAELAAGNRRFVEGRPEHGHEGSAAAAAGGGQQPHAVVLGCIDSRVPLEAIFDQTFGSICVVRSGGHVVDRAVLGSVGFAVGALSVPLIMVLGHVRCGAVSATVGALRSGAHPEGD